MRFLIPVFLVGACGGDDTTPDTGTDLPVTDTEPPTTDTTEPQGMCGDITYWDVTLFGKVHGPNGMPVAGALVHVEERVWSPQPEVFGSSVSTAADGTFEVLLPRVRSVEDCWGLLDYVAVADHGENVGEMGINSALFNAINDGTFYADISQIPIEVSAP